MSERVLITGGAGFIGSHVCDHLLAQGSRVRVLDCLSEQVHGPARRRPDYLHQDVQVMRGSVTNADDVRRALEDVDVVIHLAAMVGVGQSMYQVVDYTRANQTGTAVLLEALIDKPVRRLVVASSMSIYGEGLYRDPAGRRVDDAARTVEQMKNKQWEPLAADGQPLEPVPTPEDKTPRLASNYALSKYAQEQMCLIVGQAYNIPTVALRFFNAYGPRQALSNPYTGVIAIFASRLLNDKPPRIFEDGQQIRDFVHVRDIARACSLAADADAAPGHVINVGSGQRYTIQDLARRLARLMDRPQIEPQITHECRVGDIRNCFADLTLARKLLGYEPQISLDEGMAELVDWLENQAADDRVDQAHEELVTRGLTV